LSPARARAHPRRLRRRAPPANAAPRRPRRVQARADREARPALAAIMRNQERNGERNRERAEAGAARSRRASLTRRTWPDSRYRMPPWISLDERLLVPDARSPRSGGARASRARPRPARPRRPGCRRRQRRRSYGNRRPPLVPALLAAISRRQRDSRRATGSSPASSLCSPPHERSNRHQGTLGAGDRATSGFGLATARAIASQGCHVAITGRRETACTRPRGRSGALPRRGGPPPVRRARSRQVARPRGRVRSPSKLDILVNNAGSLGAQPAPGGQPPRRGSAPGSPPRPRAGGPRGGP